MSAIEIIPHRVDDFVIHQRKPDGYFDATSMCRAVGKQFHDYRRLDATQDFLRELSSVTGIPLTELTKTVKGGPPQLQGAWVHPDVAIHLAQWCSPKFAVAVARWVREWFGFKVSVSGWLSSGPKPWTKTFPDRYYQEILKLHGKDPSRQREQEPWLAQLTTFLIYSRLERGIVETLQRINPIPSGKRWRSRKMHQHIAPGEAEKQLLGECVGALSAAKTWDEFLFVWNSMHPLIAALPGGVEATLSDGQMWLFSLLAPEAAGK